jgi:8-oxo-dGTP pyrophosphatase MutT (NUDIX family)
MSHTKPTAIRVIAICLFRRGDQILVFEGFDSVKGTHFYRPLGGGVDAGETSAQTIVRELQEEVGAAVTDLHLLGVLESIFTVNERAGHEIVFVYDGRFVDESFYTRATITVTEDNGETMPATWRSLDWFDEQHRLVPERLLALLTTKSG